MSGVREDAKLPGRSLRVSCCSSYTSRNGCGTVELRLDQSSELGASDEAESVIKDGIKALLDAEGVYKLESDTQPDSSSVLNSELLAVLLGKK